MLVEDLDVSRLHVEAVMGRRNRADAACNEHGQALSKRSRKGRVADAGAGLYRLAFDMGGDVAFFLDPLPVLVTDVAAAGDG